jgi:hypothetical protein
MRLPEKQAQHSKAWLLCAAQGCSFLLLTDSIGFNSTGAVPVTDLPTDRWCLSVLVYSPSFKSFIAVQHIQLPHLLPACGYSGDTSVSGGLVYNLFEGHITHHRNEHAGSVLL